MKRLRFAFPFRPSKVERKSGFQIVLNKCDSGDCDCVALEEEEKNRKKAAAAAAAAPAKTTARPPPETRFKRTRGNSLAALISRRKPIPKRNRTPEALQQSPATLQSLQSR